MALTVRSAGAVRGPARVRSSGSDRTARGSAVAGWPPVGAVTVGLALGLGCLVAIASVFGTLQRLNVLPVVPSGLVVTASYLCVVAGGLCAGRLAGRLGMVLGAAVALLQVLVAFWIARPLEAPAAAEGLVSTLDLGAAAWRSLLAVAVGGLAGALGVSR